MRTPCRTPEFTALSYSKTWTIKQDSAPLNCRIFLRFKMTAASPKRQEKDDLKTQEIARTETILKMA
jgi:hypothetical protein